MLSRKLLIKKKENRDALYVSITNQSLKEKNCWWQEKRQKRVTGVAFVLYFNFCVRQIHDRLSSNDRGDADYLSFHDRSVMK